MNKVLTVVVPAYNAEQFLETNLKSFCIEQILPEIEVLIINDGSTDQTQIIAEKYEKKYPDSFRVISKKNGGHGSGINTGIENAKGKYFKIVDADDWVVREPFCKLIEILKQGQADVVYSGFLWAIECDRKDKTTFKTKAEMRKPFRNVMYEYHYQFDDIANRLYMKMHHMTILTSILKENKITIDEHCYYVDSEFITYPIPYVKTICFMKEFVYRYRIGKHGQSVGIDRMQKNEENYNRVVNSLLCFYSKLGKEIPCSKEKKQYIASIIARVVAGKFKIMLSFPGNNNYKQELCAFDKRLKREFPNIYNENINVAILLLRLTNYRIYFLVAILVKVFYT